MLRVLPRDKLAELVGKYRLQRGRLLEEQPARRKEEHVCVPRLCAVEEGVARVERRTEARVVRRVQRVEGVEDVLGERRRIDEERTDVRVERGIF